MENSPIFYYSRIKEFKIKNYCENLSKNAWNNKEGLGSHGDSTRCCVFVCSMFIFFIIIFFCFRLFGVYMGKTVSGLNRQAGSSARERKWFFWFGSWKAKAETKAKNQLALILRIAAQKERQFRCIWVRKKEKKKKETKVLKYTEKCQRTNT